MIIELDEAEIRELDLTELDDVGGGPIPAGVYVAARLVIAAAALYGVYREGQELAQ